MVVAQLDVLEVGGEEELSGFFRERGVDFHVDVPAGREDAEGDGCDGAVEAQRVVIRHEEGEVRLVVEDVVLHICCFTGEYVRRIGEEEVEGSRGWQWVRRSGGFGQSLGSRLARESHLRLV